MSTPTDLPDSIKPLHLDCPACGTPHYDEGEWRTRPHEEHLCLNPECGWKFKADFDGQKTCGIEDNEECAYGMTMHTFDGIRLNSKLVAYIDKLTESGLFGVTTEDTIVKVVMAWLRDNGDHPILKD